MGAEFRAIPSYLLNKGLQPGDLSRKYQIYSDGSVEGNVKRTYKLKTDPREVITSASEHGQGFSINWTTELAAGSFISSVRSLLQGNESRDATLYNWDVRQNQETTVGEVLPPAGVDGDEMYDDYPLVVFSLPGFLIAHQTVPLEGGWPLPENTPMPPPAELLHRTTGYAGSSVDRGLITWLFDKTATPGVKEMSGALDEELGLIAIHIPEKIVVPTVVYKGSV